MLGQAIRGMWNATLGVQSVVSAIGMSKCYMVSGLSYLREFTISDDSSFGVNHVHVYPSCYTMVR